ncbi:MAG: aminoglycoside phosphotransferase family protein [Anaerolineales bacterium]|jgi:aminoglycoside phosphotransferase (APT) family kinase protein
MNKISMVQTADLVKPPANFHTKIDTWFSVQNDDQIVEYIGANLWDQAEQPGSWQMARLSSATYVYREETTGWAIVAKFHTAKTGSDAERHAAREFQYIKQVRELGIENNEIRTVCPMDLWRGALFLEYVDGLTLEDKIAIRKSQPGELSHILENIGGFLARLHSGSQQREARPDFGQAVDYADKLVDNLSRHGVLLNKQIVKKGFERVIDHWASDPLMWDFEPTQIHGDTTVTNFIFMSDGWGVAIDWERSKYDDPASDIGRLLAEITHSINHYGGSIEEALKLNHKVISAYCNKVPPEWNTKTLLHRSRFYQATSTLRIARNGWLSREIRIDLVLQALALLSKR